jgi:hypothetical protein
LSVHELHCYKVVKSSSMYGVRKAVIQKSTPIFKILGIIIIIIIKICRDIRCWRGAGKDIPVI